LLYGTACIPKNISGVDIDGVIDTGDGTLTLIEITERRDLHKTREDIIKLRTARGALWMTSEIQTRCWCVIEGAPTPAMREAAEPHHIRVVSADAFAQVFFDFNDYRSARSVAPFGSAVDPLTGRKDDTSYIPVKYTLQSNNSEVDADQIAAWLRQDKRIILLGEYGSGKSRCIQEVFNILSETANRDLTFPISIDLRESWGLRRGPELVRRHFADIGREARADRAVTAMRSDCLTFLLDGFDEIGSQAWSNDSSKLRVIRAQALEGVKSLVDSTSRGVLVSGREHYFPSNEEMFSTLGIPEESAIVVRCKEEFTHEELQEYFESKSIEVSIPSWLPRRPLICQTIASLQAEELEGMFGLGENDVQFWEHFIQVLCERDARIHGAFDANTIRSILIYLARQTRSKAANVGPISLAETQRAFEAVVGQMPVEEASVMLQRLPSLGRTGPDSHDRQFVDTYILDGLRALDVAALVQGNEAVVREALATSWRNPLDLLGCRIVASRVEETGEAPLRLAIRAAPSNPVLAGDILNSMLQIGHQPVDFRGLHISRGHFLTLDLRQRPISNLQITDSTFGSLILPASPPEKTAISKSLAERIFGVAAQSGLPPWLQEVEADFFDSTASVASIRKIGLKPGQEVLVTIIRKTFFQRGSGRKEEALLRGLGQISTRAHIEGVLRILLREEMLTKFRGDDGTVFAPERQHAGRMKRMLEELNASRDPIWIEVSGI
jgi:hypothetical protein